MRSLANLTRTNGMLPVGKVMQKLHLKNGGFFKPSSYAVAWADSLVRHPPSAMPPRWESWESKGAQ